ncbi:MAG: hypothetical protein IKM24_02005 [Clostridia bacterium]|nr:hypothetical protein [Clostridia bacterium]
MDAGVLAEVQEFFAFLTGIINSVIEMFKSLFGGLGGAEEETEKAE